MLGANACEEADINCHIVSLLSRYSGADGMVLGQCLDLEGEDKKRYYTGRNERNSLL